MTEDAALTALLPDARNQNDAWQGNFRIGHFDAVASRYAATICGAGAIDELVLTCLDRTITLDTWSVCTEYQYGAVTLPDNNGSLMNTTDNLLSLKRHRPEQLSDILRECRPVLRQVKKQRASEQYRTQCQIQTIVEQLGIPVYAVSTGVTEKNKFLNVS